MADKARPLSKKDAPDPSNSYERSHPENEAGMGRLDANLNATPHPQPDEAMLQVAPQKQANRQLNAHDVVNERAALTPSSPDEPDGKDAP